MAGTRYTRRQSRKRKSRRSRGGGAAPLTLKFPSGTTVSAGTPLLPQNAVEDQPTISSAIGSAGLKTLISWDPDAPAGTWLHWLVVNVPATAAAAPLDLSKGNTLVPWAPPTPPPNTGKHRYIFTVFEQANPIEPPPPEKRAGFSPDSFAKTHGLRSLATVAFKVAAP